MTTPEQAAATSRDTTNQRIRAASTFETVERAAGRAGFTPPDPPQPVPMTDPIEDVTKGTK